MDAVSDATELIIPAGQDFYGDRLVLRAHTTLPALTRTLYDNDHFFEFFFLGHRYSGYLQYELTGNGRFFFFFTGFLIFFDMTIPPAVFNGDQDKIRLRKTVKQTRRDDLQFSFHSLAQRSTLGIGCQRNAARHGEK